MGELAGRCTIGHLLQMILHETGTRVVLMTQGHPLRKDMPVVVHGQERNKLVLNHQLQTKLVMLVAAKVEMLQKNQSEHLLCR
jgi:hypothetical protein